MLPMRPELLKGHLDALLLAVLEPEPQHGYAIIEALRGGQRRRPGPAHRHRVPGAAPARTGRADRQRLADRRRPPATRLPPHSRRARPRCGEHRAVWDQFSTAVTALLTRRPWPSTA